MIRPPTSVCARVVALGLALVLLALPLAPAARAGEASSKDAHIAVELVAETTSVRPGEPVTFGLVFRCAPHWHVYWKYTGDSGTVPTVKWTLPEGATAGPIVWPAPKRYLFGGAGVFVYEGEVLLPVTVTIPATLAAGTASFVADVEWLVCQDSECVPGFATLSLTLPVRAEAATDDPRWRELFTATRSRLAGALPTASVRATREGTAYALRLLGPGPWTDAAARIEFFPEADILVNSVVPRVVRGDAQTVLVMPAVQQKIGAPPKSLRGTLVATAGAATAVYDLDAPIGPTGGEAWLAGSESAPAGSEDLSLPLALLLAFLGGIVLNLMPCVLPVLSLKVMGFVERAGDAPALVRKHGFVYGAGVLASFGALAAVLLVLRAGGERVGWGFQLQDPRFVAMLCLVMAGMGASLFGAIDLGSSLGRLGGGADLVHGYTASFLGGALATVVATPCTGPFMGPALGFALTQPPVASVAILLSLGVGMAAPYVLLAAFPSWLRWVPKPGAWMDTMKTAMAFPLVATALWLAWVLGQQSGLNGMLLVLGSCLLLSFGLWMMGHYTAPHRRAIVRRVFGFGLGLGIIVVAVLGGLSAAKPPPPPLAWEAWSPERLAAATAEGRTVLVDFTADWCLTCKLNEGNMNASDEVRAAVDRDRVVLLKADWTKRDARITEALAGFGRASVPLYVVYGGASSAPVVLETNPLLSPASVVKAFRSAAASR